MKKVLFRSLLAIILVLVICLPLVACGDSSSDTPGKTPEDSGEGLKVLSEEEFKALFTPINITSENVLDYFEIKSDDNGFWLTPKENVLSVISRGLGEPGFNCQLTYNGEYEVQYKDESGNVTKTEIINQKMTVSSLYSDYKRIQLSPLTLKYVSNGATYEAPLKAITDITFTETNQSPYSVCVVSDLTPHYNDIDGEKIILVTTKFEGAVVSPTAVGYSASGKSTMPILIEEKNGKATMLNDKIDFISPSESDFKLYGGFAWFKTLIESGYFEK